MKRTLYAFAFLLLAINVLCAEKVALIHESGTAQVTDITANQISDWSKWVGDESATVVECCVQTKPMPELTFEGRAQICNGNPSLRLWPKGTRRILGVLNCSPIPTNLLKQFKLHHDGVVVFGTFTVRPCVEDEKGSMRMVCLRSAKIRSVTYWVDGNDSSTVALTSTAQ